MAILASLSHDDPCRGSAWWDVEWQARCHRREMASSMWGRCLKHILDPPILSIPTATTLICTDTIPGLDSTCLASPHGLFHSLLTACAANIPAPHWPQACMICFLPSSLSQFTLLSHPFTGHLSAPQHTELFPIWGLCGCYARSWERSSPARHLAGPCCL